MTATSFFRCRDVRAGRLAVALVLICAFYFFKDTWLPATQLYVPQTAPTQPTRPPQYQKPQTNADDIPASHQESCKEAPGAENVLVVLKTGATELCEKLPTHFVTLFRCTPHYLIFSDLAQQFGDYEIHDAIRNVSPIYKDHHVDFGLYRKLQQYQAEGQDMGTLKGGWKLDKWKFLPMMHTALEKAPEHIEWFVYMEADTSLSWTNLLMWLRTMDARKPLYLGSRIDGNIKYAHGGSGYVVSRAAAKKLDRVRLMDGIVKYDERWEDITNIYCCGDEVVASAFVEADVSVTHAWPLLQGHTPLA